MQIIQKRFDRLTEQAAEIVASFERPSPRSQRALVSNGVAVIPDGAPPHVALDLDKKTTWQTSSLQLLHDVCGAESPTFGQFSTILATKHNSIAGGNHGQFKKLLAVFNSAKDQYESGSLFNVRNLIHADVFTDGLEQAEYWLSESWRTPAAVIAGTVLESTLRELCDQHPDIENPSGMGKMNTALTKAGAYNKARSSQITSWLQIRNFAAHGEPDEFDDTQVRGMIDGIRDFVAVVMA